MPTEGTDWRRYLAALMRYKWLILAVTTLGGLASYGLTYFVSPVYRVEATLWIEAPNPRRGGDGGPTGAARLLDTYSWLDLLRSYVVLDPVVRELRLYVRPNAPADSAALTTFDTNERFRPGDYRLVASADGRSFVLTDEAGRVWDRGALGDTVGRELGFAWVPPAGTVTPAQAVEFSLVSLRDAAHTIREALDARIDPEGNFLHLRLTGSNPPRTAAVINAVADRYVAVAGRLKSEKLTELRRILEERLAGAAQQLAEAELALKEFHQTNLAPAPPEVSGEEAVTDDYLEMKLARERARRDREAIDQALRSARAGGGSLTALQAIEAVRRSSPLMQALAELTEKQAELRALRHRYTDAYPPVRRLAQTIQTLSEQTVPALAGRVVEDLGRREAALDRWMAAAGEELKAARSRTLEAARRRREVTLAEELYATLQQRYDDARLAEASSLPDVRVLDRAMVPGRPVENTTPRLVLMAVVGSFGAALAGALLAGRFDRRVRFPEEVRFEMGLPILGAIPHVGRRGRSLSEGITTELVEALRGIRLNLLHAVGEPPPVFLTISSPGSGEGKSFAASRLAVTFADAGYRTLLLDGDVRRGCLHHAFGRRRRPGLTDYLAGRATECDIIQPTGFGPLDLIGCGRRSKGAPELLGAPAMRSLLETLRTHYEVILVDSPPLAAAVDPLVLASATGKLVLVLRTGTTDRELAAAKLDMLERFPVRLLGAILNDVRSARAYQVYSYYLPGYEAREEADEAARRLPSPR